MNMPGGLFAAAADTSIASRSAGGATNRPYGLMRQKRPKRDTHRSPCRLSSLFFLAGQLVFGVLLMLHEAGAAQDRVINIKVGALLEESDHELANMFIRTIKMINERKDETIKRLLSVQQQPEFEAKRRQLRTSPSGPSDDGELAAGSRLTSTSSSSSSSSFAITATAPPEAAAAGIELPAEQDGSSLFARRAAAANWRQQYNNSSSSNLNSNSLDDNDGAQVKLEPMIEFISDRNSAFEADEKVCQLIESGVHALVGPLDGSSVEHVQSICDNMEIPYFELRPYLGSSPAGPVAVPIPIPAPPSPLSSALNPLPSNERPPSSSSSSLSAAPAAADSRQQLPPINNGHQQQQQQTSKSIVEDLTLNLHPPAHLLTSAYIDLIYAWNWTSFAIVYEEGNSMIKLQDLFRESSGSWTSKWQIKLFQFDSNPASSSSSSTTSSMAQQRETTREEFEPATMTAPPLEQKSNSSRQKFEHLQQRQQQHFQTRPARVKGHTFRDIFWRIKLAGEQNILLDVKTENLYEALKQAQQVGCMTERFSYLITSLDLHTLDLEDFKYSRTRITGFSIINVIKSTSTWSSSHYRSSSSSSSNDEDGNEDKSSDQRDNFNPFNEQQQQQQPAMIDDKYLERLGVHVSRMTRPADDGPADSSPRSSSLRHAYDTYGSSASGGRSAAHGKSKYAAGLSASVTLERSGSFMDPPQDAYKDRDWFRREMLQSSPASMGLLPSVDRDNELRLFEFFVEQQENNLSRVKLSTASAIMHDSLILLLRGLHEFDPSGQLLATGAAVANYMINRRHDDPMQLAEPLVCSLNSQPWLHGSSLANYMRQVSFEGLTGRVAFDQRGLRSQFKLDMLGMAPDIGLIKVGEWHSQFDWRHPNRGRDPDHHQASISDSLRAQQTPKPSYDVLSELYDLELKRYEKLLASGVKQIQVPYTKPIWRPTMAQRFGLASAGSLSQPSAVKTNSNSNSTSSVKQQQQQQDQQRSSRLLQLLEQYNGPALMINDIIFERLYREQADQVDTLIVTTKLSQPYFMLKETPNKLEGNDQYEGFAVDLVHELSKLINFRYRWREVADKKYGSKEVLANGSVVWNGMIGELLRGQADLAIVDLTITAQREEAVDFTLPFMNTGISILFKKPTTKVTTLFSFLSPFSSDVWAYVLAAYCGISANLFLVGHLSPYEWADPHPCRHSSAYDDDDDDDDDRIDADDDADDDDDDADDDGGGSGSVINRRQHHTTKLLENQFSLLNSFWFTIGSLMQQGSDLTPRSMSTRTIAGIWYFFTLIMISSYTANLAAFLTVEKVIYPIENVRDLSQQTEIKYGCVESGSTCTFFHDSQIDTYKRITETMRHFNTYVRSNDEGQKRVEEGKFAYFMESASIEYIVERNCNLTQIGGLLDSKGYGLATSKRSRLKRPYRTLLSEGILHLQETGMLHVLKNRWWKERRGGGTCTDDGKGGGVTELSLANVGGVFVVLLGGLGISFLVAIAEFMWRARRGGSTRDRICEEMMNDLKFALACKSSTKPISVERQQSRRTKRQLLRQQSLASSGAAAAWNQKKTKQLSAANINKLTTERDSQVKQLAATCSSSKQLVVRSSCGLYDATSSSKPFVNGLVPSSHHRASKQHCSSANEQQASQKRAAKECDPILLHAMLTMLTRQQQQQRQQPGLYDNNGAGARQTAPQPMAAMLETRQHTCAVTPTNELLRRQQQQQQQQNSRLNKRRLLFAQRTIDDMADDAPP